MSRKNKDIRVRIPKVEYLIASKLIRQKEKDKIDIFTLLNTCKSKNIEVNLEEVRSILKTCDKEEKFDYIHDIYYDL